MAWSAVLTYVPVSLCKSSRQNSGMGGKYFGEGHSCVLTMCCSLVLSSSLVHLSERLGLPLVIHANTIDLHCYRLSVDVLWVQTKALVSTELQFLNISCWLLAGVFEVLWKATRGGGGLQHSQLLLQDLSEIQRSGRFVSIFSLKQITFFSSFGHFRCWSVVNSQ